MPIKKISADNAKCVQGKTDWVEVDRLTDEQIEDAAKRDTDSALPTDEDLKEFKRKHTEKK